MKLFVGRLAGGTTQEDVNEYFTEFGELTDVFVPNPFRGFGFVTYAEQADAMKVLRMRHVLQVSISLRYFSVISVKKFHPLNHDLTPLR